MKYLLFAALSLAVTTNVLADNSRFRVFKQNSKKRATISNSRSLSAYYQKNSWNQNPTQIETGFLYLRDKETGAITEMKLIETTPSSSIFFFKLPPQKLGHAKVYAEIYSAPQEMLNGDDRLGIMKKLIADRSIKRKPFLLRVLRQKGQIIDIFDKKEEAIAAYNMYREQMGLSASDKESDSIVQVANSEKANQKKVIDTSTLQSLFMANESSLDATNEKNAELREVLKEVEKKRRTELVRQAKSWSSAKVRRNDRKAAEYIKDGVKKLKSQNFEKSREDFYQASDLSPLNQDIYEQYGVSLFRDKKFNQAIVVMELSQPSSNRLAEKDFYIGMSFFQLKDYQAALAQFEKVVKSGDKSFAATAAFYKGSSLIELGQYDKAKESFQYVLDNSTDPNMDNRAEKFIEYALDRKALAAKRSNWFFIDGVLGLIYDSNIVLARDQAREQGLITNVEGWRLLTQVSARARPYYSQTDEVSVAVDLTNIKSFDTSFKHNATANQADPLLIGLRVPWTHRTTLGQKGYFFELSPGYETIIMDLDGTGKSVITNSIKLDFDNTLVISKNWIAKGDWFLSSNDSDIVNDPTGADSISGGLRLSSIFILNKDLERYLIPDFGYRINDAKSSTFNFNRVDLGLTYTSAVFGDYMWNNRVAYYLANYENARVDNNYTLSTGLSTSINAHWNWGVMASYIINDSTTNNYKKYNVVSTFSFSY